MKALFHLDYRATKGFARSLSKWLTNLKVPDYTFKRDFRGLGPRLGCFRRYMDQDIAIDASGVRPTNRGEYRYRTNSKRGFIKIHLAVNTESHEIVGISVTTDKTADS